MKDLIKVVLVLAACGLIINICRAKFSDMQEKATYVSSTNPKVKIELTKEDEELRNDAGILLFTKHIVYLHVNGEVYKGSYKLFVTNKFKKELWVDFSRSLDDGINTTDYFQVKRNKLILKNELGYIIYDIFKENRTFIKKTWWNTWGNKAVIVLAVLFVIWLFKDTPQLLKDKEFMGEMKEGMKKTIKDSRNDLKC